MPLYDCYCYTISKKKKNQQINDHFQENTPDQNPQNKHTNKVETNNKPEDFPVLEENTLPEAEKLYEKIIKQHFSTAEEELFVYQSFLEKYKSFPEAENLQKKIEAIQKNIKKNDLLSQKSQEHIKYLEEKQWEILFVKQKKLTIKHSDISVQENIENNQNDQWKMIQDNIELFHKINLEIDPYKKIFAEQIKV